MSHGTHRRYDMACILGYRQASRRHLQDLQLSKGREYDVTKMMIGSCRLDLSRGVAADASRFSSAERDRALERIC